VIDLEKKNYDQRLEIIAELYRATEGSYANYLKARMSKSFLFEIPAGKDIEEAAKIINDAIRAYDSYYFTVEVPESGANAGKIVITGVEGNQRLFFNLWKSNGETSKHEAQWELVDECNGHSGANIGKRGFGTYDLLIQNNRLPVPEKTGYFSPSKHEMPWPNVEYDMVEFDYNSGIRNIGGSGVVGSYERSVTTHKFWVNKKLREDATSKWSQFEAALKAAAGVAKAVEAVEEVEE
jgi:hypothetical protein